MDARRLPPRFAAALAALADPDAQDPDTRTLAYLAWALLLSIALHAAVLSWIGTLQFSFGGPVRFALSVRLLPRAQQTDAAMIAPAPETTPHPAPAPDQARAAAPAAPTGAAATLPHLYFNSSELDVQAKVLEKPPLIYPENPYIWKLAGTVRVRVFIGEDGRVDTVELVSAEPPGFFEDAALAAARKLRYAPAQIRGQAVRSRKLIEIRFDPHEQPRPGDSPPTRER